MFPSFSSIYFSSNSPARFFFYLQSSTSQNIFIVYIHDNSPTEIKNPIFCGLLDCCSPISIDCREIFGVPSTSCPYCALVGKRSVQKYHNCYCYNKKQFLDASVSWKEQWLHLHVLQGTHHSSTPLPQEKKTWNDVLYRVNNMHNF